MKQVWKRRALAAALATAAAAPMSVSAQSAAALPELDAVKWYNTPPLSLANLSGKAVLVEVFRTW